MFGWFRRPDSPIPIDTALWREATAPWLFMRGLPSADAERLRAMSEGFLARKHFSGTHGSRSPG
jgi:Mlc titration factor MtfA (ptsG expression regulator)